MTNILAFANPLLGDKSLIAIREWGGRNGTMGVNAGFVSPLVMSLQHHSTHQYADTQLALALHDAEVMSFAGAQDITS
ncbi:hypothetical protein KSC_023300 [Ktedonobacter sp. SOSP1-52]|uniref:hypothetical protein n=1 Tax=Ktedonobacter sp. SOSP1-52 TaxID=2778366 RepID=UPI00191640FA|nr:hypothetical protein [Ktedonobacter sp. SOSP1-52]GHO63438.1 hypothetical protein KSC_023300 [Ktedonobacter sp. SOSP1-52]